MKGARQRERTKCTGLHLRELFNGRLTSQSSPLALSRSAPVFLICRGNQGAQIAGSLALTSV